MPESAEGDILKSNLKDNQFRGAEDEIRRHGELVKVMSQLVKSLEVSHGKENENILTLRELVRVLKENNAVTRHSSEVSKGSGGGNMGGLAGALRGIIGGPVGGLAYLFMGKVTLEKIVDVADGVIRLIDEQIVTARKLRATLAMPGMNISQVGTQEMWAMAKSIDATMKKYSQGVLGLEDFQKIIMELKQSGMTTMPLIDKRSLFELGRDIGKFNVELKKAEAVAPTARAVDIAPAAGTAKVTQRTPGSMTRLSDEYVPPSKENINAAEAMNKEAAKKSEDYQNNIIKPLANNLAYTNGELVAFSIYLGKLAIETGVSTDALIKNGGALYRQEIGFEKHGRSIENATQAIAQAAEFAMLSQDKLAGINRPADEFVSDMTNATNVIRFFSTDMSKSKKELIKLNIAESTAINNLIYSLTDVVNLMNGAFKPDLTQSALTLEMIGRYPEKFPGLSSALSKATPEGRLVATDRLSTFSAPEFEEWKKKGSDMRLIPSFFKDISEDLGISLEKALELAPEVGKARLETPELLLNSMGLRGGARAFAGFELLPTLFPWLSKLDTSQGRQTTDALLQFGAGVNLTKEQLEGLSRAASDAEKTLRTATTTQLDAKITDEVARLSAGVFNAFIESFGGKEITVKEITASGETLKFEGTLNLTIDGETKTYTPVGSK